MLQRSITESIASLCFIVLPVVISVESETCGDARTNTGNVASKIMNDDTSPGRDNKNACRRLFIFE